jgi:biotin carboxyl carrier protein
MKRTLCIGNESHELEITRRSGKVYMTWDGDEIEVDITRVEKTSYSVIIDGSSVGVNVDRFRMADPDLHGFRASLYDGAYEFTLQDPRKALLAAAMARQRKGASSVIKALMPGKVLKLLVKEGERLEEGQPVLILEAMKMQNEYVAPAAGIVGRILVEEGVNLEIFTPMVTLLPDLGAGTHEEETKP